MKREATQLSSSAAGYYLTWLFLNLSNNAAESFPCGNQESVSIMFSVYLDRLALGMSVYLAVSLDVKISVRGDPLVPTSPL